MKKCRDIRIEGSANNLAVLFILILFFVVVAVLNAHLLLHFSSYPKLLAATILILGALYGIGFPLGMWLHASKIVSIKWDKVSIEMKHYFKLQGRAVTLDWSEISTIIVTINESAQTNLVDAIKTVELNVLPWLHFPRSRRPLKISIKIVGKSTRTLEITSLMFGPSVLRNILKAAQYHHI
jgi:hypothetical protein